MLSPRLSRRSLCLPVAVDRRHLPTVEEGRVGPVEAGLGLRDLIELVVDPEGADRDEDREDDGKDFLGGARLDLAVPHPAPGRSEPALPLTHLDSPSLPPGGGFVLGRSSITSSQSRAVAMRARVSIRGGLFPRSMRAMADWVVPQSSASSRWEMPQ